MEETPPVLVITISKATVAYSATFLLVVLMKRIFVSKAEYHSRMVLQNFAFVKSPFSSIIFLTTCLRKVFLCAALWARNILGKCDIRTWIVFFLLLCYLHPAIIIIACWHIAFVCNTASVVVEKNMKVQERIHCLTLFQYFRLGVLLLCFIQTPRLEYEYEYSDTPPCRYCLAYHIFFQDISVHTRRQHMPSYPAMLSEHTSELVLGLPLFCSNFGVERTCGLL